MTNRFGLSSLVWSLRQLSGKVDIVKGRNCVIATGAQIRASLTLEDDVLIAHDCIIDGGPVSIGRATNLLAKNWVTGPMNIGRYCAIAPESRFLGGNHPVGWAGMQIRFYDSVIGVPLTGVSKGPKLVGNDVWVGTRSIIMTGVTIGDGAVIGAGSVVTKDVPPYSITAGNPASHIRYRFSQETIAQLLTLKWWDWPTDRIRRNRKFFTTNLDSVSDLRSIVLE